MIFALTFSTSATIRLSTIIADPAITQCICVVDADTNLTIIDDISMHMVLKIAENARIDYQIEPLPIIKRTTSIDMQLMGRGAEIIVEARALLHANQQYEITTYQRHYAPQTRSHVTVRLVHHDYARSWYNGIIEISNGGAGSEAFQDHKALLVSPDARAYARPTLEAKTNDIQCGHGSAIGYLDAEQLWYLNARGIVPMQAEKLLITAFLGYHGN